MVHTPPPSSPEKTPSSAVPGRDNVVQSDSMVDDELKGVFEVLSMESDTPPTDSAKEDDQPTKLHTGLESDCISLAAKPEEHGSEEAFTKTFQENDDADKENPTGKTQHRPDKDSPSEEKHTQKTKEKEERQEGEVSDTQTTNKQREEQDENILHTQTDQEEKLTQDEPVKIQDSCEQKQKKQDISEKEINKESGQLTKEKQAKAQEQNQAKQNGNDAHKHDDKMEQKGMKEENQQTSKHRRPYLFQSLSSPRKSPSKDSSINSTSPHAMRGATAAAKALRRHKYSPNTKQTTTDFNLLQAAKDPLTRITSGDLKSFSDSAKTTQTKSTSSSADAQACTDHGLDDGN